VVDAVLRFVGKDAGLETQFRKVRESLSGLERSAGKTASIIGTGFTALAGVVAAIGLSRVIGEIGQFAEEIKGASARTGILVTDIQRLKFIAEQSETSFDSIASAINRMQNQLIKAGDGSKEAAAALDRLGIEVADFQSLSPDQQFERVATSIAAMEDPAERTAAAMGLFGKSGAELLPTLVQTGAELGKLGVQFDEIGGPVLADSINAVDEIGDSFSRLKLATLSLATELVGSLSPALTSTFEALSHFVGGLRVLAGGGGNEIVNLSGQIDELTERRDALLRGSIRLPGPERSKILDNLNQQIDALTEKLQRLLGTGLGGVRAEAERQAALLAELTGVEVTAKRLPGESSQERRERSLRSTEDPLVQIKTDEKDLLVEIHEEMLNEIVNKDLEASLKRQRIASDTAEFLAQARETFGLQEIKFEEIKNQSIISIAGSLFGALARENSKLAKIQQGIALAQAIWNTAAGITEALKLPFPASLVAAAKVALVGGIQIAKIKSTNYNGGSVSGGGGVSISGGSGASAEGVPSSPPQEEQRSEADRKVVNLQVFGWSEGAIREIVDRIREVTGDFDLHLVRGS